MIPTTREAHALRPKLHADGTGPDRYGIPLATSSIKSGFFLLRDCIAMRRSIVLALLALLPALAGAEELPALAPA